MQSFCPFLNLSVGEMGQYSLTTATLIVSVKLTQILFHVCYSKLFRSEKTFDPRVKWKIFLTVCCVSVIKLYKNME